jgi:hypothetical protein
MVSPPLVPALRQHVHEVMADPTDGAGKSDLLAFRHVAASSHTGPLRYSPS